jgi:carboxyl-terminal processing protease
MTDGANNPVVADCQWLRLLYFRSPNVMAEYFMKNKKLQAWLPLLLSVVMVIGMWAGYQLQGNMNWQSRGSSAVSSGSAQQVLDLVKMKYVDTLNMDSIETAAIEVITDQLDPHSIYIPPMDLADENASLQGNFSGIGIEYQIIKDTLNVVYVLDRGPSDRAGLKTGDQILKVDTTSIIGINKTSADLHSYLRGKAGSKVKVTLLQNGKVKEVEITRGSIPIPSLDAAYMAEPGVGYIRLNKFAETTYREFMDAATGLQAKGMRKMILDLRGNGGGLLQQATNIADELLPDGKLIVSTRGSHVKTREVTSSKPGLFEEGELVLLIDEFSASASEVLAGALQDNDRGTIIGRRSFGKGLVQEQYDLDNGGALRLTVARYYTPTGRSIQKPYSKGNNEKYREEILERFHGGGTYVPDSVHAKAFTTRGGKKLYDGGGITPDILLPFDSSTINTAIAQLYRQNVLSDYVFSIFKDQRSQLQKYPDAAGLLKEYKLPDSAWPGLVQAAHKDSVTLDAVTGKPKDDIELRIKALLARYIWRSNGYFQVMNMEDSIYRKALEVVGK